MKNIKPRIKITCAIILILIISPINKMRKQNLKSAQALSNQQVRETVDGTINNRYGKYLSNSKEYYSNPEKSIASLREVIKAASLREDSQTIHQAYLEIATIYKEQKKYDDALEASQKGVLLAYEENDAEALFRFFREMGEINLAKGDKNLAISAYKQALWNLKNDLRQTPIANNLLLYNLGTEAKEFIREYVELLLESNQPDRAVKVLESLKLSEFQDYFNDPCFDIILNSNNDSKEIENELNKATIYTFVSHKKFYTIVKYNKKYTIRFIEITESDLIEKLKLFRYNITRESRFHSKKIAKELHEIIISPLKDLLPNSVERLVFVRDEYLRNVPLEALIGKDGKYLIEKYAISYIPGLPPQKSLNIAGGNFILALSESKFSQSLNFTKEEAKKIAEIIGAEKYIDAQFTRALLYRILDKNQISTLHIATHGSFGSNANDSYIEVYDEKISLIKFQNRLIQSRKLINLLNLSGCETAVGSNEAVLGFAGVSVRAGIPNIVASIWSIPDYQTAFLMEEFYRNLAAGESIDRAKQLAQIKVIEEGESPRSWAGIILITN